MWRASAAMGGIVAAACEVGPADLCGTGEGGNRGTGTGQTGDVLLATRADGIPRRRFPSDGLILAWTSLRVGTFNAERSPRAPCQGVALKSGPGPLRVSRLIERLQFTRTVALSTSSPLFFHSCWFLLKYWLRS